MSPPRDLMGARFFTTGARTTNSTPTARKHSDKGAALRRSLTITLLALLACIGLVAVQQAVWAQPKPSGTVSVLYAGSLGAVMEKGLAPAAERTTGHGIQGEGHGSVAAARMIRDRLRTPDVFVSADPAVNVRRYRARAGVRRFTVYRNRLTLCLWGRGRDARARGGDARRLSLADHPPSVAAPRMAWHRGGHHAWPGSVRSASSARRSSWPTTPTPCPCSCGSS